MRLNWQHASSQYRLRQKKQHHQQHQEIYQTLRRTSHETTIYVRDDNAGRLGTGSLGPHPDPDETREIVKIQRELKRCGIKNTSTFMTP